MTSVIDAAVGRLVRSILSLRDNQHRSECIADNVLAGIREHGQVRSSGPKYSIYVHVAGRRIKFFATFPYAKIWSMTRKRVAV